jgi:hypothetical protein
MKDRRSKRKSAVRRLLDENEPVQLRLFEVSDRPLRNALFNEDAGENENEEEPHPEPTPGKGEQ